MRELIKLVGYDENGKPTGSIYMKTKNKKTMTKKLELKKYCRYTRKHVLHKESR